MAFDNYITDITQDKILPKVVDAILDSNPLTLRLLKNPKPWAGHQMKVPVQVTAHSAGGSFGDYDLFDTTRQNLTQSMAFDPKGFYQSVTISNLERAVNRKSGVVDAVRAAMEMAQNEMMDGLGDDLYGDGTGNGSKAILGLVAAVDDGTNVATYGGVNRSTYTAIQGNYTASVGNLTLSGMATMYDSCVKGADSPTLIVTTPTVWSYYEELLQPTVVANYNANGYAQLTAAGTAASRRALGGEIGFDTVFYRGTPIVRDSKCTAGYMYFLNEKYLNWYSLEHPENVMVANRSNAVEGIYSQSGHQVPVVSWTGFRKPINQDAITGQLILYGELINRNPNRSGVLRGITGV